VYKKNRNRCATILESYKKATERFVDFFKWVLFIKPFH